MNRHLQEDNCAGNGLLSPPAGVQRDAATLQGAEANWFALFVATNNEKKVYANLQTKGVEAFLPLYTERRRWKNRTSNDVHVPLFPGYVFARFARNTSARVLEVPRVYAIVSNSQGAVALPAPDIEALQTGARTGSLAPHPGVSVGQRARICRGPLAGVTGVVTRVDGALRVVLTVQAIMRSVAVRVESDDLEALPTVQKGKP